jgi:hypothetical protein
MKTRKKVQNRIDAEFLQSEEARIINSVVPSFNITYEGISYQELSPIPEEEDNWWDSCFESRRNRRSK